VAASEVAAQAAALIAAQTGSRCNWAQAAVGMAAHSAAVLRAEADVVMAAPIAAVMVA